MESEEVVKKPNAYLNLSPIVGSAEEVKPEVRIRYPTRAPFMRYMEKLVAPKASGERALLEKRPAPGYMLQPWPKSNPFTMIKNERIKELRRQADDRRKSELTRCRESGNVAHKVPRQCRQHFTAYNNLKELIYEENLKEVHAHGRLFGPPEMTFQPRKKHNVPLLEQTENETDLSKDTKNTEDEKHGGSSGESGTSKRTDTNSLDSSQKESVYDETLAPQALQDEPSNRSSTMRSVNTAAGAPAFGSSAHRQRSLEPCNDNFDQLNTFINDRKKVCLVNLAIRTKEGEINRLNKMLEDEAQFLANEEKELIIRHDEHDKYLKAICLKTAEAIKKADKETRKRIQITDKIKRTRYKLAHMNAECIKLEEEFLRLSTYKDFLDSVAKTLEENRAADRRAAMKFIAGIDDSDGKVEEPVQPPTTGEATQDSAINAFFRSPQDLVDILAELESNNLTLIENVQEQEEACERLRLKAAKLQKALNAERSTVDEHIAREENIIAELTKEIMDMENSREQIKEFTLLERYDAFSLGSIDQFDPPWLRESRTRRALDEEVEKPTVGQLLDILHEQIYKLYVKIFGTEGTTRPDILVMLKMLESVIDDLARSLGKYSRVQVLKAKKTVDEHNRLLARQRQKEVEALAHEAKLKRAIEKTKEPPRWHRGRRIVYRSQPPREEMAGVEAHQETAIVEDSDADLFA